MIKKGKNNEPILFGIIFILLIAVCYLSYEKFRENKLSKLVRDYDCTAPSKICALIAYKYTDKLEVQVILIPGKDYFTGDKLKDYENLLSKWKKKETGLDFDSSLIIDNFQKNLGGASGDFFIVFEDSDGFEIDKLIIDVSDKSKDISNNIIQRMTKVVPDGTPYGTQIEFKKDIAIDQFKRINNIDIMYHSSILDSLPQ